MISLPESPHGEIAQHIGYSDPIANFAAQGQTLLTVLHAFSLVSEAISKGQVVQHPGGAKFISQLAIGAQTVLQQVNAIFEIDILVGQIAPQLVCGVSYFRRIVMPSGDIQPPPVKCFRIPIRIRVAQQQAPRQRRSLLAGGRPLLTGTTEEVVPFTEVIAEKCEPKQAI